MGWVGGHIGVTPSGSVEANWGQDPRPCTKEARRQRGMTDRDTQFVHSSKNICHQSRFIMNFKCFNFSLER